MAETDALGQKTRYGYDMAGRVVSITRPTVAVLGEDGVSRQAAPVETFQYDRSGRLVAQGDANGGLTKRTLLAGTGYGGTTALVTAAFQADGGVVRNSYDGFGDLREQVDAMSHHTRMGYDALGRLTSMARPGTSADFERPETYGYDVLGQRIRHGIGTTGGTTGLVETTEYDQQGRVVAQVDVSGDRTTTGYAWDGALSTGGMGTFGGWRTVTGTADGRSVTSSADVFGRVVSTVDAGGHRSSRQYDVAGRLASVYDTDRSQRRVDYGWLDTGLLASERLDADTGAAGVKQRAYGYDALGHRTRETLSVGGMSYQDATAVYDGLGRMTTWSEAATDAGAAASMAWGYDAVGNIRQTVAVRPQLDQTGAVVATAATETLWYAYDAMNRVTIDGGALAGGHVVRGTGASMAYDVAGRRVSMAQDVTLDAEVEVFVPDRANQLDGPGHYEWRTVGYAGERREFYAYAADGALSAVTTYQSGYVQDEYGSPTVHSTGTTNRWAGSSTFGYDAQGRQTRQVDTDEKHRAVYDRATAYDAAGRVTTQTVVQLQDVGLAGQYTQSSTTTNAYGQAGTAGYAQGQVLSSTTTSQRNQEAVQSSATTNAYVWYAGAQLASATTTGAGAATTRYTYDAFGALASVRIEDARARDVTLVSDTNGQAIRRDEADGLTTQGDPHERWYRFGGVEIGHVGNNGAQPADYARSVDARGRSAGSQPFAVVDPRYGAGFAAGAERITSYATGSAAGGYAVRSGDTLAGIAQSLWGDGALWYKLAEANGLTAGSALPVGRTLSVPAGVVRSRYNASTFKPYDPADALGDTNPVSAAPTAKAAGKAKCGAFGQILLSVIAIAVTAVLPGSGVIAGVINGAIGSVVSQGVGLATGLQDRFSFKGVALAAIGGGVGKALGGVNAFGTASGVARVGIDVARGAIGSAATQGIALATGLQDRFDWAGVAAAGVIGGIGGATDRGLARAGAGGFGRDLGASAASALAGAGARSLLTGTDFGDTILAVLPDVIGTTLGRAVARGIVGGGGGGLSPAEKALVAQAERSANAVPAGAANRTWAASSAATYGGVADGSGGRDRGGGSNASSGSQLDDIVIVANRHMVDLFQNMTNYQFGRYTSTLGDSSDHATAHWASSLQPDYSQYWRSLTGGQSISSYAPNPWNDITAEFRYVNAPGYQLRDSAYQDLSAGNYLAGSLKYAGSLVSRTLSTVGMPFNLAVSAARDRGFQPAPVDRLDAPVLALGLGTITGGLGRLSVADSVPLGYTRAYRAVSHAEFDDIAATGRFNQGPNSLEGKWFADRYDDVLRHGDGLEGPGNYRVVQADLPDNAPSLYRVPNLDNRGPARFLHMDDLKGVTPRPYRPR